MRDTGPAKLPALPRVNAQDPALRNWISAVTERLEVREGSRGNDMERVVTQRELKELQSKVQILQTAPTPKPGETLIPIGGGMYAAISVEAFAESIRSTRLYKDLMMRIDDPARFDALNQYTKGVLLRSISEEASKRGAEIKRTETILQTETESLAMVVTEITAALGTDASGGIRTVEAAYATFNEAQALSVTQLEASLGNYYQDGAPGRAVLEETMLVTADKVDGLAAEYMVKLSAGGAVVGFGLAATEDPSGATESAFIIQAGKFAVVMPSDTIADPMNPPANRIPFGVDASGVYINGQVRINASGATLDSLATATGVYISYDTQFFKYSSSGAPANTVVNLTANLTGTLTGFVTWSVVSGYTGAVPTAGTTNTWVLALADMTGESASFLATKVDAGVTYTDTLTVVKLRDGADGLDGVSGARGSITGYASGSAWSDTTANNKITSVTGSSTKVIGDTITISNGINFAATKYWSGAAWVLPGVVVDGNLLVNGTISADRIVANSIASAEAFLFSGTPTAVLTFGTAITSTNSTALNAISVVNSSNVSSKILVVGTGRSGVSGTYTTESLTFGVFRGSTLKYDYGWSPASQDAKAFAFVDTVPANSTYTYTFRAAKTSTAFNLTFSVPTSVYGVRN